MKLFFFLFLCMAHTCIAQQADTIWYNNKWEKSDKDQSAFYRVIKQKTPGHYLVKDFFSSGEIQMEGSYLSLNPDVKDGDFVYWSKDGKKEMD
ncbi:TonB family protein [Arcticibacter svalbardensis MN12-7]|uniref:TonB family protein n=1 Tax=Arcticibacter svalbardensis MN12-7 TaxID=1150600 RepID=R9H661_9SPHI|nr:hypothetical protein [Arcticibacter svalbardensis]EOR96634.1 TonB family protein [Arcticibacter svalbardensis MN12-7]